MKKIIALLGGLTLFLHTIPVGIAADPIPKSFTWWCEKQQTGTKVMLETLLKIAGTKDCKKADLKLKNVTKFDLGRYRQYTKQKGWAWVDPFNDRDMILLGSFDRLETLNLSGHSITNIDFLSHLKNLTEIDLGRNCIADIKSLSNLPKLTKLNLQENNLTNIQPLKNLHGLTTLDLSNYNSPLRTSADIPDHNCTSRNNKIVDIKPLGNLKNLTYLSLDNNKIVDIEALGNLKNLTYLSLYKNNIVDIRSLGSLKKLTNLILIKNKIADPVCPLPSAHICSF
jgi:internalin A